MFEFIVAIVAGIVLCGGSFVFGVLFERRNSKLVQTVISTATTGAAAVVSAAK